MTAHLNLEQRALARRLRAQGMSLRAIAKQVGCGHSGVDVMLRGQARDARPIEWIPRDGGLVIEEREEILRGLSRGYSLKCDCSSTTSLPVHFSLGRLVQMEVGMAIESGPHTAVLVNVQCVLRRRN